MHEGGCAIFVRRSIKMFIRLSILLPSLIALSHAFESCVGDDPLLKLFPPQFAAGSNNFSVLYVTVRAPIFNDKFQLTIQETGYLNPQNSVGQPFSFHLIHPPAPFDTTSQQMIAWVATILRFW